MAKALELQLQHQSFQWIVRVDTLWDWLVWSPCWPRDSQESSPIPQFENIHSLVLSILYGPALSLWSKLGLTVGSVLVWRPYIKADWLKKISVCHFQHLLREAWGLILSLWTGFLLETLKVKTHLPILHLRIHPPPSQANIHLRFLSSQISLGLPHWRHILYHLSHQGSHLNLQPWSMWPSLQDWLRNWWIPVKNKQTRKGERSEFGV